MNNEITLVADLLELKRLVRDFGQLSYTAKKIEDRFPDIEFAPQKEILTYIRTILALKFEMEDNLKEFEKFYKKYKDKYEVDEK